MEGLFLKSSIAMYYAGQGVLLPFLPVLFKNQNFSYGQIGTLLAAGSVVGIFTQSLWGYLCDKFQTVKKMLLLQLLVSVMLSLFIFHFHTFSTLLLYLTIFYIFYKPLPTLLDTLTVNAVKTHPAHYGRYRMFGSLGFLLAALFSGYLLNWLGLDKGPCLITMLIGLTLFCTLPVQDAQYICQTPKFQNLLELVKKPVILQFLLAAVFLGTTQSANDNFISVHLQALGGSLQDTGLLWTIGVTTEVLTFIIIDRLKLQGKALYFLCLVSLLYGLRWLLMSFVTEVKFIMIVQTLHGICYSLFITMIQQFLVIIIPDQLRATGQGLMYMAVFGLGGVVGMIGGGLLMEHFGFTSFYLGCFFCALIAFILFHNLASKNILPDR